MIGYLSGKVIDKTLTTATILAGQVGYEVSLPTNVLAGVAKDGEAEFWIYTHVREDALLLFGFLDKDSLEFFKLLLSVSGVGPKVALAIISAAPILKLQESISKGDPTLLSTVSGVGRKTAEKAVIELKGKLGGLGTGTGAQIFSVESEEVLEALVALGFSKSEALGAISALPENVSGTDDKIKLALKRLGKK